MGDPSLMHKLTEVDPKARTAVCAICGPVKVQSGGKRQGWRCQVKARQLRKRQRQYNVPYRKFLVGKSMYELRCTTCGFIPARVCQIDIHHIDRDHSNNEPTNLEILCACCHRLEHLLAPPLHTDFP